MLEQCLARQSWETVHINSIRMMHCPKTDQSEKNQSDRMKNLESLFISSIPQRFKMFRSTVVFPIHNFF
jgi:hypothetical protein